MKQKKALITGITGQDGSYLAEHLLSLGYEVHGIVRRVALEDPTHHLWRLLPIADRLNLHSGTLESFPALYKIFRDVQPDECYHLAAQSFVSISFEDEFSTMQTNINGTHFILAALKDSCPECRFYFAGSSEMFCKVEETSQSVTRHCRSGRARKYRYSPSRRGHSVSKSGSAGLNLKKSNEMQQQNWIQNLV